MTLPYYLLLALIVFFVLFLAYRLALAVRQFLRFGGKMLVTCPETQHPAAVNIDNWRAVLTRAAAPHHLQLSACSRLPERRECGQECLCHSKRIRKRTGFGRSLPSGMRGRT